MKAKSGDPIPTVPDATWERTSRRDPTSGPRCYICNALITGDWRKRRWMCVGPGEDRKVIEAYDPSRAGLDVTQGGQDMVHVGNSCIRKFVPLDALVPLSISGGEARLAEACVRKVRRG